MSVNALSTKQFNTEHSLLSQGNEDELATRVRGVQNMTSNVFRPSFSQDLTAVQSMPSGTAFKPGGEERAGGGVMENEDEE
jgi:hypothetical protein